MTFFCYKYRNVKKQLFRLYFEYNYTVVKKEKKYVTTSTRNKKTTQQLAFSLN